MEGSTGGGGGSEGGPASSSASSTSTPSISTEPSTCAHECTLTLGEMTEFSTSEPETTAPGETIERNGVKITLDGDKDTHDRMRPLRGGQGTFDRIVKNIRAIAGQCRIAIGGNFDESSVDSYPALLDFLRGRADPARQLVVAGAGHHTVRHREHLGRPPACFVVRVHRRPTLRVTSFRTWDR